MGSLTIISGGQTGIDRMALEVARKLGLETGGSAPKGFLTENGPDLSLREFGLVALETEDYPTRTRQNVLDSDGTAIYGDLAGGTKLTKELCIAHRRPYILSPSPEGLAVFIREHGIQVLNVAGSRGSKLSRGQIDFYRQSLHEGLYLMLKGNTSVTRGAGDSA